jgi:hypothetical protein
MKTIKLTLMAGIIVLAVQCKKKATPAYQPPAGSYGLVYNKIFAPSCALSGCHKNEDHGAHAHAIGLEGSNAYAELVGVTPKNTQAAAAGLKLIAKGDTSNSFLFHKIQYNTSPHQYGAPMPGGGLTLSDNKIKFIKQWIMAGAPETGHVADSTLLQ